MSAMFEKTLIDASCGYRSDDWELDPTALRLPGRKTAPVGISFFRLHGGRQEGADIIQVDNGVFDFMVVPTRGMGILDGECHGVRLGWDSPVEEVVHPQFVNLESMNGIGWLNGFNEWVVRCGLSSNGAAFTDASGRRVTLHGTIANTPASLATVSVDLEAPYTIRVTGRVVQVGMFLDHFVLETEIATEPGANWIRITDRVTNCKATPACMQMLYHNNYGTPLMSKGARVVIPAECAMPRDSSYSRESIKGWNRQLAPTPGIGEECWFFVPKGDRAGNTRHMLVNGDGDLAVVQAYSLKSLPCFALWKNPAATEDGYVTGLEPATNYPNPTDYEQARRRTVKLAPGKSWEMAMTISLQQGRKEIAAEEKKIKAIQGRRPVEVLSAPRKGFSPAADGQ